MRIETDVKLDFKDVLIRPKRSTLNTRSAVDVNRTFRFLHTGSEWQGFPLIAANMDVTGTMAMAHALGQHGALTALHKHYPEPKLAEFFAGPDGAHAFYSLGTTAADVKKLAAVAKAAPIRFICLDVANGYAEKFLETVKRVRDDYPHAVIMAGNVVTGDMTEALILAGADIVKIGIGPGSVCTTRRVTGVGYPQLSAIIECADAAHGLKGQVCADGGCTVPGDVAKAYGAGADFVMLGGMLAGHDECDGEIHYEERDGEKVPVGMTFYGMSSETAMKKHSGGVARYRAAEGKSVETPYRGPVDGTMGEIMGGVRSMMTYIGAAHPEGRSPSAQPSCGSARRPMTCSGGEVAARLRPTTCRWSAARLAHAKQAFLLMAIAAALKAEDSAPVRLCRPRRAREILGALAEIGTPEREAQDAHRRSCGTGSTIAARASSRRCAISRDQCSTDCPNAAHSPGLKS